MTSEEQALLAEEPELSAAEQALFDFADRMRQEAQEYGWPGAVTVIERVLAELLENGR